MAVPSVLPVAVRNWLEHRGYSTHTKILGGKNNQVFHVQGNQGQAALKIYRRDEKDPRDRFLAEQIFYQLVAKSGVSAPCWLDSDETLGISLLSWLEGGPLAGHTLREEAQAAASFVLRIHAAALVSPQASLKASEACFSVQEHTELLQKRLKLLSESARKCPEIMSFIESTLAPQVQVAVKGLQGAKNVDFAALGQSHFYSPGDFGLHNAMRLTSGSLAFYDFEYSGWDDPVKTVSDIFLQPEKPVDWAYLSEICQAFDAWPGLEQRVRAWSPFFATKWAVILLNHALKTIYRQDPHSEEEAGHRLVQGQISKAKEVMKRGKI